MIAGAKRDRYLHDVGDGPDPLIVLERQVAEHLLLRARGLGEAPYGFSLVRVCPAEVEHESGVRTAD